MSLNNSPPKLTLDDCVLLGQGWNACTARVGDISIITVDGNCLTVRVNGRKDPLVSYGSLVKCGARLPNSFFRAGRNCIVNLGDIANVDMSTRIGVLKMKDGTVIDMSRAQSLAFRRHLSL